MPETLIKPLQKSSKKIVFNVENRLFLKYLENFFSGSEYDASFIQRHQIATFVSENTDMTLILQSEEDEYELIEVASRLKRVFGDKLSILFLSLDYSLEGELSRIVDGFAQFPLSGDELLKKIEKISRAERRVLLIDDSKLIHKTVVQGLSDAGFQVFQAFDGQEGVEKAIEVKPDVIICDIEMPRMNGYEACSAIRRTADVADAHIIMSSTLSSAADQKKGFQVGVDEYVTKPVVIEDLVKQVERAFQNTAGGRENVLVLEKNTPFAKGLTKSLSQQGFSARISENIQKAVRSLKNTSCDLLIAESDPIDGTMVDLFNVIGDLPIEKRPDVIIMIPHQNQVDDRMARNSGAVGVLSKPFSHDAMLALVERALAERRSRKEREQLQRYVSKASLKMAVEKAVLGTNSSTTRADKKQAGVFFSDIANFTARCEKYEPKEIVTQINTLFDVITKVIIKNDGDIDKFIGDACMAFWMGEDTQSSQISVLQSILEIKDGIDVMNSQHDKLKDDPIKIRMGVNYGEVILCDLGASDARVDLTIISDSVNVAARLESASKQYGVDNLISQYVLADHSDKYLVRVIDRVKVKGKSKPLMCYELLAAHDNATDRQKNIAETFAMGFELYSKGDFKKALSAFEKCLPFEEPSFQGATNPSFIYIDRCKGLIENPPVEWDGIASLDRK